MIRNRYCQIVLTILITTVKIVLTLSNRYCQNDNDHLKDCTLSFVVVFWSGGENILSPATETCQDSPDKDGPLQGGAAPVLCLYPSSFRSRVLYINLMEAIFSTRRVEHQMNVFNAFENSTVDVLK